MAEYNHRDVEEKWQNYWEENHTYRIAIDRKKPKYYVLDMFPYPSGAGLHVGHPLGYIATDIISRFKRLKGFNVLHPMGFDAFGLPAEQYAIQTGQHPAITTEANISRYKEQLKNLGFSYDWSREVRTSDPGYYKWTQWIFKQLFNSWYNKATDKAEPIDALITEFAVNGNEGIDAACDEDTPVFNAGQWMDWSEEQQQRMLLKYRLTYIAETTVNWCAALGTVLSNDEVKDGFSERGGHPVIKKTMPQWSMRITAYADRLLAGLEGIDWPESIKEMQRNWIGKSLGAEVDFKVLTPNPSPKERGLNAANIPNPSPKERGLNAANIPNPSAKESGLHAASTSPKGRSAENWGVNPETRDVLERWKTANPRLAKILVQFAKENRKSPTEQEDALWQRLRNKTIGFKVRRQHPVEDFIVDFVFLNEKLVVEVDGPYHESIDQKELDLARKEFLESAGYKILVIKNEEVDTDLNKVVTRIKHNLIEIEESSPSPVENGSGVEEKKIRVFTTRIDTIFGVTFMVVAPEADMVKELTTPEQAEAVEAYVAVAKNRSERERMSDVKTISGVFTGSYVLHPFSGEKIPVWIADYVLAGYGTGAVMAVPSGDQRDFDFAKHFDLPIVQIIDQQKITETEADPTKEGKMINSGFLDGLTPTKAIDKANEEIVKRGIGMPKVNYRLRDAIFGRQRYWGEPIPVYFKNGIPYLLDDDQLPLELPEVDKYLPTEDGEPPLGRADNWQTKEDHPYELTTMPGWAGSSWYFFRYMDPDNSHAFASQEALDYWQQVDFYMGGSEHATGHLLYSRFWTKFLYDMGHIKVDEYAKKLVNQGMIQGRSNLVYRASFFVGYDISDEGDMTWKGQLKPLIMISKGYLKKSKEELENQLKEIALKQFIRQIKEFPDDHSEDMITNIDKLRVKELNSIQALHIPIEFVSANDALNIDDFKLNWPEASKYHFYLENGKYICGWEIEKMSKSKFNVVNPDDLVERYGADTLRMYEMFLGPVEQSKPWNTNGIEGVFKFLRKFWGLFHDNHNAFSVSEEKARKEELKVLHSLLKKVEDDIKRLSLNTSVSSFMIAVNELNALKCNKREILERLTITLAPFAPHLSEELWRLLGHNETVFDASFPIFEDAYLEEDSFEYPIMVNGKMRAKIQLAVDLSQDEIQKQALTHPNVAKWLEGKQPKKVIIVPRKIVNVVV